MFNTCLSHLELFGSNGVIVVLKRTVGKFGELFTRRKLGNPMSPLYVKLLVVLIFELITTISVTNEEPSPLCPVKDGEFMGERNKKCYFIWRQKVTCAEGLDVAITSQAIQNFIASKLNDLQFTDTRVTLPARTVGGAVFWFTGEPMRFTHWRTSPETIVRDSIFTFLNKIFPVFQICPLMCPPDWTWNNRTCQYIFGAFQGQEYPRICTFATEVVPEPLKQPSLDVKPKGTVIQVVSRGKFVQAEAMFTKLAPIPSTCSRYCIKTNGCVAFDFNRNDKSCRGFHNKSVLQTLGKHPDSSVWELI